MSTTLVVPQALKDLRSSASADSRIEPLSGSFTHKICGFSVSRNAEVSYLSQSTLK